jgi:hypothetical protein
MQARQPDGRFRGNLPIEITERSRRARWVKAEAQYLRDHRWRFVDIAGHITGVGRRTRTALTPIPDDLAFPIDYQISSVACWKACNQGREPRRPLSEFQSKLEFLRLEELFRMALIRAREGDVRAARTAVRILEKEARLFRLDFDRRRKPPS